MKVLTTYTFYFQCKVINKYIHPSSLSPVVVPGHLFLFLYFPQKHPPPVLCVPFLPFPQGLLEKRSCPQCSANLPVAFPKHAAVVEKLNPTVGDSERCC